MHVTDYYNRMTGLWLEIDKYRDLKMKCNDDIQIFQVMEHDRPIECLTGLNVEYDQIRLQILGKGLILILCEFFFIVRVEESQWGVMLESIHLKLQWWCLKRLETKGMRDRGLVTTLDLTLKKKSNRDVLWCTYCNKSRHS